MNRVAVTFFQKKLILMMPDMICIPALMLNLRPCPARQFRWDSPWSCPVDTKRRSAPRSGLAAKHHITVTNSPGTVDANYRGEVKAILYNLGKEPFTIKRGDRIAQMVICKLPEIELQEVTVLSESDRGTGGFGSTGK